MASELATVTLASFSPSVGGGLGRRHLDPLVLLGVRLADLTVALLLGHLDLGLVDGAGRGLLAEGVDVAGLVGDVLDVDVDQAQADLLQLDLDPVGDVLDQLVAVGVDLLDRHGRDHDAHLAEDDVLRQFLHLRLAQPEQAFGGILHDARLGRDPHREGRGRVDPDVLLRQRPLEADVDRHRGQVEELARPG